MLYGRRKLVRKISICDQYIILTNIIYIKKQFSVQHVK